MREVVNGPWTRVDPTNSETKSVLDMIIVSKDLEQYIDTLQIDSERRFTPFKQNKGKTLSFPDHFGLCLKFKGIPLKSVQTKVRRKYTRWNTNRKGGWKQYQELTTNNMKLEEIAFSEDKDPDKIMSAIDKEMNAIKFISFGKVKVREKEIKRGNLEKLIQKKDEILKKENNSSADITLCIEELDQQISKELQIKQKEEVEKELASLYNIKETRGRSAAIFALKGK